MFTNCALQPIDSPPGMDISLRIYKLAFERTFPRMAQLVGIIVDWNVNSTLGSIGLDYFLPFIETLVCPWAASSSNWKSRGRGKNVCTV